MDKLGVHAKKLLKSDRILSGLLRIESILEKPDNYYDKIDEVGGWVKNLRMQNNNKLIFVELSDGSTTKPLQVVIESCIPNFEAMMKENTATCIKVKGKLVRSPGKGQPIEILVNEPENHMLEIIGSNTDQKNYPLMGKYPSLEFLRENLHLRPRSNIISSMTRVRNSLAMATHQFYQELGFMYIHTPLITASDCEGAGEMFQVSSLIPKSGKSSDLPKLADKDTIDFSKDFFGSQSYLTVSGQLAVENYACAMTNVYTFGPTFRAENSNTTRHLSEFWMIEPEICFAGLNELFDLVEGYLKFCIEYCLVNVSEDLAYFNDVYKRKKDKKVEGFEDLIEYLKNIKEKPFSKMSYSEAIDYLLKVEASGEHKFTEKLYWGVDLDSEHERYLCEKHVKGPLFLYNYPKKIKPFYMKVNEEDKTVQNMDLLLPFIGEVVGGSVREDRLDVLESRIDECGLDKNNYKFYTDLRKYGTVPHCGFGLGFERMVRLLTGIENIKDTIPFPRYPGHCQC